MSDPSLKLRAAFQQSSEEWLRQLQAIVDQEVADRKTELDRAVKKQQRRLDDGWAELEAEKAKLSGREVALQAESNELKKEKLMMAQGRSPRDILKLNVAGQADCAVLRSTLCVVEDSMLASRFSGRWDDSLEKDEQGRFFIDFPAELFLPVVDFLRQKAIEDPSDPVQPPVIPEDKQSAFRRMLKYYGLASVLLPCAWLEFVNVTIVKDQVIRASEDQPSFGSRAIVSGCASSFTVHKSNAGKPWYDDAFRFGLITATKFRHGPTPLADSVQDWVQDGLVSPSGMHEGINRSIGECIIRVFIDGGDVVVSRSAGADAKNARLTLSKGIPQHEWHVFVALTYPWVEVSIR